jgi:uncharacterized membrane protein
MNPRTCLSEDEVARLEAKIAAAESRTSAQIKIAIASREWLGIKRRARRIFQAHGLDKTAQRNCVLVLLVLKNRELLIYGDEAVHQAVGQDYWNDVRDLMMAELRQGHFYDGLAVGVQRLGEKLAALFPVAQEARDEISNQLLFVA